ncbi:polyferredoxin [Ereboglobus sp. PH5-5]|uniref:hypothetical protein n=1 Tax=unclassified Ereboglobus TaxID=2626932 RepID=UPI002406B492|nr:MULTISPECIES: hypothetical protein [unclassified Ereboglobus]MDF9827505.1 polyferredoxin [Ereboglobus sp. PH5-10]MDF9834146.1 polyferredoxin [Ereboglobus sp. PH5-5]
MNANQNPTTAEPSQAAASTYTAAILKAGYYPHESLVTQVQAAHLALLNMNLVKRVFVGWQRAMQKEAAKRAEAAKQAGGKKA